MSYESNQLIDLKREALVNGDVAFLRQIKAFEERCKTLQVFYIRKEELIIRDEMGNVVDPDDLPVPKYEPRYSRFMDIEFSRRLYNNNLIKPGNLTRSIEFVPFISNHSDELYIYEVPESTVFPILKDFNVVYACAQEPIEQIDKTLEFEIKGRENVTIHIYWNQFGHKTLSRQTPFEWEKYSLKESI